ncbi:MAG: pitrilysin family protein [Pseudomonadota bacterium]
MHSLRCVTTFFIGVFMLTTAHAAPSFSATNSDNVTVNSHTVENQTNTPHITRLANGLTVFVLPDDRFPLASLRLYVHAGSTFETPEEAGISHVLEHMVFKGTEKRPKGAVALDVERAGGYLNAATSFDYTVYLTDMPSSEWKLGLDVLKDMAFHPSLDPEELESEKKVIIAELERGEDTPSSRVFQALQGLALKDTPYKAPIIGYRENINAFTTDMIRDYITKHYQPQSMLLVVVGNVHADEVLAEAEMQFGALTNHQAVPALPTFDIANLATGPKFSVQYGPWKKVHFGMALPVPAQQDLQSPQLDVLAHMLAGDGSSRLYKKFKYDLQLVDSISVGNYSFERAGIFYMTAVLDADKVEAFWNALTQELASLQGSDFSQEELSRAKLNLEDALYTSKETVAGMASKEGYFQFFNGGPQGEVNYLKAIQDVNSTQLDALLKAWITPENVNAMFLLPEGVEKPQVTDIEAILGANWPSEHVQDSSDAKAIKADADASTEQANVLNGMETIDLGHGRSVILIPDTTLPYTSLDMVFSGGNALLTPDQQGLAALAARTITKGAGELDTFAMADFQADHAASLNASAGRETFNLSMRQPTRFDAAMFGLLRDVIEKPSFADVDVERERKSQIAAITSREDQPLGLAFRHLTPFLFPESPYGYFHLGQKDAIAKFTTDNVKAFWQKQSQEPWVMAVAGDFDREAVLAFAKSLPLPTATAPKVDAPTWTKETALDLTLADRNQAHILMVFPTVGAQHEDVPALDLLQAMLAGQSGLLFRDLRDNQGLGYTVTAFNWQTSKAGFLAFYIGTDPSKIDQSIAGFRSVIADLHAKPLDNEELVRGKNQLKGDYYREHQRLGNRSSEAAVLHSQGYPLDMNIANLAKAEALTPEEIQAIAQQYLQPEGAYLVKVLP